MVGTGDDQHRLTIRGQVADPTVDLRFRSHVDSTGGLIEEEHVDIMMKESGESDLLLVSPGERGGLLVWVLNLDTDPLNQRGYGTPLLSTVQDPPRVKSTEPRKRGVLSDGPLQSKPLLFAIFTRKSDPERKASMRGSSNF